MHPESEIFHTYRYLNVYLRDQTPQTPSFENLPDYGDHPGTRSMELFSMSKISNFNAKVVSVHSLSWVVTHCYLNMISLTA